MRLRQLARKLEVKPEKIISLLAESGHELANEANGKLSAEQVVIVEGHFAKTDELNEPLPDSNEVEQLVAEPTIEEPEVEELAVADEAPVEVPFGPPADVTSQVSEALIEEERSSALPPPTGRLFKAIEDEEEDPDIEVIKAPKVELEGLKVVGKIDLPEPKPKKEETKEDSEEAETEKQQRRRNHRGNRKGRHNRKREHGNPVERERRRQQREEARKKREAEKKLKEKKKQHYLKQVQAKQSQPKPKKKSAVVDETPDEAPVLYQSKSAPEPPKQKGALRRFWGWLNGEYDKY